MDRTELAQVFNDSYERVTNTPKKSGEFFSTFYALLIADNPEVANKFRNTDMHRQVQMLKTSVAVLLSYYGTDDQDDYLRKMAERHSKKDVDIPPRLYSVWLDSLIETVRRFDPKFNDAVAVAWRRVFEKGIEFMTSRYEGREKT